MNTRYDEAAREARERVKAAGRRDLETLKQKYPVGSYVMVGEGGEIKRLARVKGHELSTYYKPLVVTTEGVYFAYEVENCEGCETCGSPYDCDSAEDCQCVQCQRERGERG